MSLNFKYKPTGKQVIPENIRITCEYCGRTIDTATDDHCPSCGAVYDANAHLQEHKRRQEELRKMKLERQQMEMKRQKMEMEQQQAAIRAERNVREGFSIVRRVLNTLRKGCMIPVILVILIAVLFLFVGIFKIFSATGNEGNTGYETPPTQVTQPEITEVPTEVTFGEKAEMIGYSVVCDKMEVYHYPWSDPKEGFYYVRLHLIVANKGEEKLQIPGEMLCQYEKGGYKLQAEENTIRSEDLNTRINLISVHPDSAAEGWVYYEVPLDTDLILKYDEYITVHIPADSLSVTEEE